VPAARAKFAGAPADLVQNQPKNGNETTHRKIAAVYSRLRRSTVSAVHSFDPEQNKQLGYGNQVAHTGD
jgi:hypothetical protein